MQAWQAVNMQHVQQVIDRWLIRAVIVIFKVWITLQILGLVFRPLLTPEVANFVSPDVMIRIPQRVCSTQRFTLPQKVVHLAFLNGPTSDDDVLETLVDTLFRHGYTATFFLSNETYMSERTETIYKQALTNGNTLEAMVPIQEYNWRNDRSLDGLISNISSSEAFVQRLRDLNPSTTAVIPSKKYIWASPPFEQYHWFRKNHYQLITTSMSQLDWLMPTSDQAIVPWKQWSGISSRGFGDWRFLQPSFQSIYPRFMAAQWLR
jgi:hypothetical protein